MSQDISWREWCSQVAAFFPDARLPPHRSIHRLIVWWGEALPPEEAAIRLGHAPNGKAHKKTCACGAHYDEAGWGRLDYVGLHLDDEECLELRNCICGSTLAVVIANGKGETK